MVWTCDWTLQISKSSPILSSSFSDGPHTARPLYTSILHLFSWFSLLNSGVEELKLVNLNKDQVWALTQNRPQVTAKLSQWGGEGTSLSWESQKEENAEQFVLYSHNKRTIISSQDLSAQLWRRRKFKAAQTLDFVFTGIMFLSLLSFLFFKGVIKKNNSSFSKALFRY